jgi:hypothetical protein
VDTSSMVDYDWKSEKSPSIIISAQGTEARLNPEDATGNNASYRSRSLFGTLQRRYGVSNGVAPDGPYPVRVALKPTKCMDVVPLSRTDRGAMPCSTTQVSLRCRNPGVQK